MAVRVIVPSATMVSPELQADFGQISPVRLPIRGTPISRIIWNRYSQVTSDIVFALSEREAELARCGMIDDFPCSAKLAGIGETTSLGDTVLQAWDAHPGDPSLLIVNLGDTLVERATRGANRLVVGHRRELVRWTTVAMTPETKWQLFEKDHVKPRDLHHWVLVGVFEIERPREFIDRLRAFVDGGGVSLDPFYEAIYDHFGLAGDSASSPSWLEHTEQWLDFGHIDSYYVNRLSFGAGERCFNTLNIDLKRGVVTKSSRRRDHFEKESGWYDAMPDDLRPFAPRTFRDLASETLKLEYYGYPSVQDLYIHGNLSLGDWEVLLQALGDTLDAFRAHVLEPPLSGSDAATARRKMYLDKTRERLLEVASEPHLHPAFWASRVNGEHLPAIDAILDQLEPQLARVGLLDPTSFSFIHGDFCLSNVLYDRRNRLVRLVDPRGSFGPVQNYGDPLYDEAKLSHSFNGDYDLLVNDKMTVSFVGNQATLTPALREGHAAVKELFNGWQQQRLGARVGEVRLIESLLFLSMVPLHGDRPKSQQAFVLRGRQLFAEAVAQCM